MAKMAVSTHLQGGQVGAFIFFGFLLQYLSFFFFGLSMFTATSSGLPLDI